MLQPAVGPIYGLRWRKTEERHACLSLVIASEHEWPRQLYIFYWSSERSQCEKIS
jgi:hypothetical protein